MGEAATSWVTHRLGSLEHDGVQPRNPVQEGESDREQEKDPDFPEGSGESWHHLCLFAELRGH